MEMIRLSAWVSLAAGALLIGPEYIAPSVVAAASCVSSPLFPLPTALADFIIIDTWVWCVLCVCLLVLCVWACVCGLVCVCVCRLQTIVIESDQGQM